MEIKFVIILSLVLLVPMVYASSFLLDAYAAIRDPGFDTGKCETKGNKQTCCWTVPGTNPGVVKFRVTYCQTCTYYHDSNGDAYEKCTDPKKQEIKLPGSTVNPQDLPQLQLSDNNTNSSSADTLPSSKLLQKGQDLPQLQITNNNTDSDVENPDNTKD